MHSLILAAGAGSRLYPFTKDRPKCMVSFGSKRLIDYICMSHRRVGVEEIAIVSGYLTEKMHGDFDRKIYNSRYQSTNMVYSLFQATEYLQEVNSDEIIISYADIIYEPSLLECLINKKFDADIVIVSANNWQELWNVRMDNILDDVESFKFDTNMSLLQIGKKVKTLSDIQGQYIGLFKINPGAFEKLHKHYLNLINTTMDQHLIDNMYMTDFIQSLVDSGVKVKVCQIDRGWLEFDTVSDLTNYTELLTNKNLEQFIDLKLFW